MTQELEEQQRIVYELKDQLRSLEADRVRIIEQIKILEARLAVQDLRNKVRVAAEENDQLRAKKDELQDKLESQEGASTSEEQVQIAPEQEESPRKFF